MSESRQTAARYPWVKSALSGVHVGGDKTTEVDCSGRVGACESVTPTERCPQGCPSLLLTFFLDNPFELSMSVAEDEGDRW